VRVRDDANLSARPLPFIGQPNQRADLVDGEPKRAGTADEVESFEVLGPI